MKKEITNEIYAEIQKIALNAQDYKIHSCFVGGKVNAESSLKAIEESADKIKACVKRLRDEN